MSESRTLVDWGLAERTATTLAGAPPRGDGRPYGQAELESACADAIETAAAYSRLEVPGAPAMPELIDRREWSRISIRTLAIAAAPVEERLAKEISLPGPLGAAARRVIGTGAGVEAGLAVGYVARRVLGQYDVPLFESQRSGRLLFVGPNLDAARAKLDADRELFLGWIALHETTHVLQLESVHWLAPHIRDLATRLVESAGRGVEAGQVGALARRFIREPRELAREVLRGHLARLLADPAELAVLDRLQATMAVIEGHAEHVMDACAASLGPGLEEMRSRLEAERATRGGLGEVIARLLGLEVKLRQYAVGKRFWDAIVAERGADVLELPWRSAADLPDLGELEDPHAWLARVAPPVVAR